MPAYDSNILSPPGPLARVSIRAPNSGKRIADVPMLIDSGADLTLLPATAVEQLGLDLPNEHDYELEGFDGSKSIARSVKLELAFLTRRFTGRFILLDSPCGILGRNVLNHFAILLDGPSLNWEQMSRPVK
jgi:hypothetical protein